MSGPTRSLASRRGVDERTTEPSIVNLDKTSRGKKILASKASSDRHQPPRTSISSDTSLSDDGLASILESLAISQRRRPTVEYRGRDIPIGAIMSVKTIDIDTNRFSIQFIPVGKSQPVIEMPISSTLRKTAAVLRRGKNDPLVVAISGWSNMFPMEHDYVLDKQLMTERVFKMCAAIGHKLPRSGKMDGGRAGAYYACHAEKQLLASMFFDDLEVDVVKIYVSRKPCEDCKDCMRKFVQKTGVEVKLHFRL